MFVLLLMWSRHGALAVCNAEWMGSGLMPHITWRHLKVVQSLPRAARGELRKTTAGESQRQSHWTLFYNYLISLVGMPHPKCFCSLNIKLCFITTTDPRAKVLFYPLLVGEELREAPLNSQPHTAKLHIIHISGRLRLKVKLMLWSPDFELIITKNIR